MIPDAGVTLLGMAARSVSGTGVPVDVGTAPDTARLVFDVAAVAGTGATLQVTVETSTDGALWRPAKVIAAVNTRRRDEHVLQPIDRWLRASWTITGSPPTFTFALGGWTRRPYATLADLRAMGLSGNVLASTSEENVEAALWAASCEADGMLAMRYKRPITAWGSDVRLAVCKLAAWHILSARGFNPESPSDASVRRNRDDAFAWLSGVAKNEWEATGVVDATPDEDGADCAVVTERSRRWW
jgi:phage gp36-like protein